MIEKWFVLLAASVYLIVLLGIAYWANSKNFKLLRGSSRSTIYALSLGIYTTGGIFYGSVSLASWEGLDFIAIYFGPAFLVCFGSPLIRRVIHIAKAQNVTSIADFIAARYGKSVPIAALTSAVVFIGSIPYISYQLRMVAASYEALVIPRTSNLLPPSFPSSHVSLSIVTLAIIIVTILINIKRATQGEKNDGLLTIAAFDSLIKLAAFLTVGIYVTYGLFNGFTSIVTAAERLGFDPTLTKRTSNFSNYIILFAFSALCALLQPRNFHMLIVENRDERDIRKAAWLTPLYCILLLLFILPITLVSLITFGYPSNSGSMALVSLPLLSGNIPIAMIAFIGGLSAATLMVVVEATALAIMVSNHIILPMLLRDTLITEAASSSKQRSLSTLVQLIRYFAIILVIGLAFIYQLNPVSIPLSQSTYFVFGVFAQLFPAFILGLFWARGTALGTVAGIVAGTITNFYMMFLPNLIRDSSHWKFILDEGPFGISLLKPIPLLGPGFSLLNSALLWGLAVNTLFYIVFSLVRAPRPMEKIQANAFVGIQETASPLSFRFFRSSITVGEIRAAVARYLGNERTDRSFKSFAHSQNMILDDREEADLHLLRFAEHLLASVIGAASSRLALSLVLRRRTVSTNAALKLLDDASAALQYSRDLLQHAVDHARQGITVLDKDMTVLTWNHAFVELYELPPSMMHIGIGLDEIIRFNAERGSYGPGSVEELVSQRMRSFIYDMEPVRLKLLPFGKVIEIRTNQLPEGGYVTTYTDITDTVTQEEERKKANETLELRVKERTEELTRLNAELTHAKSEADEANISKTRFLAAAGHDILQPLNAARLYSTSLIERAKGGEIESLAENVNASLDAVEEILTALLDISRLDTGALRAQLSDFRIEEILVQLQREFEPVAKVKNLKLHFVKSSLTVRSDRRLLRRLLQNLISNAIKYTPSGSVLVGVKRNKGRMSLQVWDTGLGIPETQQKIVFHEFKRLDQGAKVARGLGLGLSIVERISRVLDHRIDLFSEPGKGSVFRVDIPIVANVPVLQQQDEPKQAPATPLAGMKVLAIDNEPVILEGMKVLLQGWGCKIITAAGVEEALSIAENDPTIIDAVIADYHLDDGDGLQAIKVVREAYQDDILAVLITADRSPAVREMAAAAEVHLLNKPLKPAVLRALLGQWKLTHVPS
ncbi:NahK/ErcS family hybrid sensor histidine kinase/response regulator [Microvirga sp. W0021]|uniref:histidine kinase n=1 Tax=Hohaiivirga grylli TaxID=3133970 RepID=A0ABV0BGR6_9HYPH